MFAKSVRFSISIILPWTLLIFAVTGCNESQAINPSEPANTAVSPKPSQMVTYEPRSPAACAARLREVNSKVSDSLLEADEINYESAIRTLKKIKSKLEKEESNIDVGVKSYDRDDSTESFMLECGYFGEAMASKLDPVLNVIYNDPSYYQYRTPEMIHFAHSLEDLSRKLENL